MIGESYRLARKLLCKGMPGCSAWRWGPPPKKPAEPAVDPVAESANTALVASQETEPGEPVPVEAPDMQEALTDEASPETGDATPEAEGSAAI